MPSYTDTLNAFTAFLAAYTHSLLYLRALYPRSSFVHARFHNTSAYQSRHPLVCEWIRDALDAVRTELLDGTVARIAIVIFSYTGTPAPTPDGSTTTTPSGDVHIMERFLLDVSAFPVLAKDAHNTTLAWSSPRSPSPSPSRTPTSTPTTPTHAPPAQDPATAVDTDLSEQFRAALIALTTRCAQLAPLPQNCSFNISMELKDEADVDPPLGHPQAWIPVQPSLQKTGRRRVEEEGNGGQKKGRDLGGVRVTPIRTVEAGTFRFETWVEEGRAKMELVRAEGKGKAAVSFSSSGD